MDDIFKTHNKINNNSFPKIKIKPHNPMNQAFQHYEHLR